MNFALFGFSFAVIGLSIAPTVGAGPTIDPNFFRPFQAELAALSPDGHHLAYTSRLGSEVGLTVLDIDLPEAKTTLSVADDAVLVRGPQKREIVSASVRFLRWADANTLIYQLHAVSKAGLRDEVRRIDAAGKNDRKLVDAEDFAAPPPSSGPEASLRPMIPRPPRVLGFDPSDSDFIFVEAQGVGPAPTETFSYQLSTGKSSSLGRDESLHRYLYDRKGRVRVRETGVQTSPGLTQHYELDTPGHWQPLDQFLGPALPLDFLNSPERYYGHRSFPLAFDGDEETLYFASNQGRETYGIYALDLRTKRRTDLAVEDPSFDLADPEDALEDSLIIFDRKYQAVGVRLRGARASTRWWDGELAKVQQTLDHRFSGRTAKIVDWDDTRARFLVSVYDTSNPPRFFIYESEAAGRLIEILRGAPKLDSDALSPTTAFSFTPSANLTLTGTITLPRSARISPLPLVVYCRDLPGRSDQGEFNREIESLASAGFAVAQINYRGSPGLGTTHREAAKTSFDRIPAEDTHAVIVWLSEHYAINRGRIALVGEGFGGYLATRALELYPEDFRCAIALNLSAAPPPSLGSHTVGRLTTEQRRAFFGDAISMTTLTSGAGGIKRPLLLIVNTEHLEAGFNPSDELRQALKRVGNSCEYWETNDDLALLENDGRAKVYSRIADFLNEHSYDNAVNLAPLKEVK